MHTSYNKNESKESIRAEGFLYTFGDDINSTNKSTKRGEGGGGVKNRGGFRGVNL
jgi:hypothetical protein